MYYVSDIAVVTRCYQEIGKKNRRTAGHEGETLWRENRKKAENMLLKKDGKWDTEVNQRQVKEDWVHRIFILSSAHLSFEMLNLLCSPELPWDFCSTRSNEKE